jgi:flavin-dependent dehydrogenase
MLVPSAPDSGFRIPRLRRNYDVAILGAGPAGAGAALALARHGCSVAVVGRARQDAPRIGETLPPQIMRPLVRLGIWERFIGAGHMPAPGTVMIWGGDRPYQNDFVLNPYGDGWHIDREHFDRMLLEAAQAAGADAYCRTGSLACTHDCDKNWIIEIANDTVNVTLKARWVIDATGRAGWFARRQQVERRAMDHLVALVRFGRARPSADSRTLIETCPDGWWYAARLPNDRAVAAFFTDADLMARDVRQRAEGWSKLFGKTELVSSLMQPPEQSSAIYTVSASTVALTRCAGTNWLAIGDAAQCYDPVSGQGITKALLSALAAAQAINARRSGDHGAFASFAQVACIEFEKYQQIRLMYYRRERRWRDNLFWRRRHALHFVQP